MFCGNAGLRNYLKIRLHISSALLSFLACWPPVQINSAHLQGEKEHCQGTALLFGMLVFSVPFPLETTNSILSLLALWTGRIFPCFLNQSFVLSCFWFFSHCMCWVIKCPAYRGWLIFLYFLLLKPWSSSSKFGFIGSSSMAPDSS